MSGREAFRKKRVYLDTNTILNMSQEKRRREQGIGSQQVTQLRRLAAQDKITVLASVFNVEELLAPLQNPQPSVSFATVQEDLRFLADLASKGGFVDEPRSILDSDIQCCLGGEGLQDHVLPGEQMWERLSATLESRNLDDMLDMLAAFFGTTSRISDFVKLWNGAGCDFLHGWGKQAPPSENEMWHTVASYLVRDWAARRANAVNLDDTQVHALLGVKSIRLAVGHLASLMYELVSIKGRRAKRSDSRDHMHVISASVADIFVTGDEKLMRIVRRIPDRGIDVLTLTEFLAQL